MVDITPIFSDTIHWPNGITEQVFLDDYWQKKPLLIRQAFPAFDTPLPADELAGLALEDDIPARLITRDKAGGFSLEHGPFTEERLTSLPESDWSLLVTDIEKHVPEFAAYLQPFRFIPDWRIDDLMISYAPDGASVGAHVDEYDVFLLQGSGTRRWSIDARSDTLHEMRSDGDMKILANFDPTDSWELLPGDMLYLPPNMAHHGIAVGELCTTWSVGFRAPRVPDFTARLAELISEQMGAERYTDAQLTPAKAGEISHASIEKFRAIWDRVTSLDNQEFAVLLGRFLTESNSLLPESDGQMLAIADDFSDTTAGDDTSAGVGAGADNNTSLILQKSPFSRFAWIESEDANTILFVDGETYPCNKSFACTLCANNQFVQLEKRVMTNEEKFLIQNLVRAGCLLPLDEY